MRGAARHRTVHRSELRRAFRTFRPALRGQSRRIVGSLAVALLITGLELLSELLLERVHLNVDGTKVAFQPFKNQLRTIGLDLKALLLFEVMVQRLEVQLFHESLQCCDL